VPIHKVSEMVSRSWWLARPSILTQYCGSVDQVLTKPNAEDSPLLDSKRPQIHVGSEQEGDEES